MTQVSRKGFVDKNGRKVVLKDPTKADKVVGATAGNLASLDEEGNLQDSGKKPSDITPLLNISSLSGLDNVYDAGIYRIRLADGQGKVEGKILQVLNEESTGGVQTFTQILHEGNGYKRRTKVGASEWSSWWMFTQMPKENFVQDFAGKRLDIDRYDGMHPIALQASNITSNGFSVTFGVSNYITKLMFEELWDNGDMHSFQVDRVMLVTDGVGEERCTISVVRYEDDDNGPFEMFIIRPNGAVYKATVNGTTHSAWEEYGTFTLNFNIGGASAALAAAVSPVDICLFEDSRVQEGPFIQPTDPQDLAYISAQAIDTVVECLKNIIRHVCAEEYHGLVANVYLRAKTYESLQAFEEHKDEDATMVHVYTTPKPSSSNVDFHIELLRMDAVWYTVVQNVHRTSDSKSITFEDATFAEFWDKTDAVQEKDLHEIYDKMSFTPKTLTIQTDEQQAQLDNRFVPNSASTANLWLACSIGKCYKVKVLFEDRGGDNYEVLCTAIASGTGSDSPVLKLYFGLYTLMFSGDGGFTAEDLKNGQTSPSETGWDVTLYDNTTLFAGLQ